MCGAVPRVGHIETARNIELQPFLEPGALQDGRDCVARDGHARGHRHRGPGPNRLASGGGVIFCRHVLTEQAFDQNRPRLGVDRRKRLEPRDFLDVMDAGRAVSLAFPMAMRLLLERFESATIVLCIRFDSGYLTRKWCQCPPRTNDADAARCLGPSSSSSVVRSRCAAGGNDHFSISRYEAVPRYARPPDGTWRN